MIKHDLKCQFKMNDVMKNDANCKNDAENEKKEHRNEKKHESDNEKWNDVTTSLCKQN